MLICPDSGLGKQKAKALLSQFAPSQGAWQIKTFWGDETPQDSFFESFDAGGLLGTSTCLLVHSAERWNAKIWDKIEKMLPRLSPYCWPIFCLEGEWTKGSPKLPAHLGKRACLKLAEKNGWVWRDAGLSQNTVHDYVTKRARELGYSLPPDLLRDLAQTTPLDALSIDSELTKLALYYAEKDRLDVREWQRSEREQDIFTFLRNIQSGNLPKVLSALKTESEPERAFFTLSVLLDRNIRAMWKNTSGFGSTASLPRAKVAQAMSLLVDVEWKLKQGSIPSVAKALDTLVIEMTRLFARRS